ncbi:MAG: GWxTD domain-containing protein [bacterium]
MFSKTLQLSLVRMIFVFGPYLTLLFSHGYAHAGIKPSLDVAQFQDAEHRCYLEVYYSIPEAAIKYIADNEGKFSCQLVLDLHIYQNESLWASKVWKIEKSVEDTSRRKQQSQLVDLIRYQIEEPGSYRIVMHAKDMSQPDYIDSTSTEIVFESFSDDKLEVSDIQLASNIKRAPAGGQSVFLKNVYEIVPNPGRLYGVDVPLVYYYFEAYNLMDNVPGDKYKTLCQIKDSNGRLVTGLGRFFRTKRKVHDSSVEMGMMNIASLPSGKYTLVYGIADSSENVISSKEKKFFVYNPNASIVDFTQMREQSMTEEGKYGPLEMLSEKELDEEFDRMVYITTKEDIEFFESLTNADAKRKFIFRVWQAPRISNPEMTGLIYRETYLGRVRKADISFKSIFRAGWKSDRGRVFILYGPPTHVERFPSTQTALPYQIWTYDHLKGQGGVIFVFIDRTGFNKYELIHSTLRGELQEPDWPRLINRGTSEYR